MGFNYRQKRKEFEENWAKTLKQYIAAGMTQEQITAVREFDEELWLDGSARCPLPVLAQAGAARLLGLSPGGSWSEGAVCVH